MIKDAELRLDQMKNGKIPPKEVPTLANPMYAKAYDGFLKLGATCNTLREGSDGEGGYAGDLLLQKFFTNNHIEKKQCFNRGKLPQYFVAEDHEPIIDRNTYDAVQAEIARRAALHIVAGKKAADEAEDDVDDLMPTMALNDCIHCGICGKKYRRKMARLGTPYAAPIWICGTFAYRGKAYCASKQIPEKILIELITAVLGNEHSADDIDHIEMHPNNRVLFVFTDGHTEEHFWKDHSRRDSWDAEKRRKAAEKTKAQPQARKERAVQ